MLDFLQSLHESVDFPAVVLSLMLIGMALAMISAQRRSDFDWGDAFRDDNGKVSWFRAAVVVSLGISSWVLIYAFMNGVRSTYDANGMTLVLDKLFAYFVAYMVVWSGAKIIEKALDIIIQKWFPKPVEAPKPAQ